MALAEILSTYIPGRSDYVAREQQNFNRNLAGLGALLRMESERRQQEQMAMEQQMQPLRMDALRAQIERQNQEVQMKRDFDQRQKTALSDFEGFLNQKYPGTPQMDAADNVMGTQPAKEVQLFKAAAALDPRNATDLALSLAGMKSASSRGGGVDPMIQRLIAVRDQYKREGRDADAEAVQREIDRFENRLRLDEAKFADISGTAPVRVTPQPQQVTPAQRPAAPAPQGQVSFPSGGYNPNPTPTTDTLMADAGTNRDMSRQDSLRGAMGVPALSPKAQRDIEVANTKKMYEINAKQYDEFRDKIPALNATVRSLDRLQQLADSGQTFSNAGSEFKMQLSNIAQAFKIKINVDELASSELARQQLAELLKARLGSKDYGSGNAVSNLDLVAAREPLPELVKSPEGQKRLIRALAQDARESLEDISAFRTTFERNRGDMGGFRFPSEQRTEERLKTIESSRNPRTSSGQIRQGGQVRFLGFE